MAYSFSRGRIDFPALKLTCHNINSHHIFLNIKSISAHPLLIVMHDFICTILAVLWATGRKRKIQYENLCLCRESNQRIPAFQRVALTTWLSRLLTTSFKTFTLHFTLLLLNTFGNACMKLILVRCVLELTVRQNLHFFYQYRCYLLLFTERCMNRPHHNQFHTCIFTRVE